MNHTANALQSAYSEHKYNLKRTRSKVARLDEWIADNEKHRQLQLTRISDSLDAILELRDTMKMLGIVPEEMDD